MQLPDGETFRWQTGWTVAAAGDGAFQFLFGFADYLRPRDPSADSPPEVEAPSLKMLNDR